MVGAMLVRLFVLAAMLAFAGQPASAHSPYFTQIEKIDLPDGTQGEMRLLHGDGILVSDPVRVIAVDSLERLIAQSERGYVASIICPVPRKCIAYLDDRILELTPAAEPGPVIANALRNPENQRWELEGAKESFGFSARDASFQENVAVSYGLAKRNLFLTAIHAALGALSALVIICLVILPMRRDRILRSALFTALALIAIGALAAVSIAFMLVAALPDLLWIGSIGLGFVLVFVLLGLRRGRLRTA